MSKQYTGGLITKTPVVPTSLSASGVWSLSDQAEAQATNTWPFPRDPQFNYVTMLLHGDGSAGVPSTGSGAGASSTVTAFNTDASTNNFNVAINGDARSNNFNPYQEGYYSNRFDGSGDYLTVPNNAVLNVGSSTFTLECWFFNQQNALSGAEAGVGTIASKSDYNGSNSNGYSLFCYDGANNSTPSTYITFFCNGVSFKVTSSVGAVPFNTWTHIAVVKSGTTLTIYANGVSVGTSSSAPSTINDTSTVFIIGSQINGTTFNGTYPLSGLVSNLRLVKGTAVYTAAFTPPTAPLTAITNTSLLTCQSNRFIDNSTNAFTITKNGDTAVSPAQPFTLPSTVATYGSGYFDGTGDSLSLASSSTALPTGTQDFSVEMYLYWQTQGGSYPQLISNPTTSGFQIYYDVSAGALAVGIFNIANVITYTIAQSALSGVWTHLAVTRSGTTFRLFVNGVLQANGTNVISFASLTTQYIASDGSRPYTGYMTDVRTVLGAIPTGYQTSSTTNGTSVFTPPTSPLTAVSSTALLTTQYNGGGNNSGFKDSSQFNFPITRNGNTTQGTFTPYSADWSNYFNGSSDYFSLTDNGAFNFGTGDATVEYWFNSPGTSNNYPGIISSVDYNASGSASIRFDNTGYKGKAFMYVNGGGDPVISSTTTISYNTWNHIAIVRQGTSLKLYLNGTLDTTVTISVSLPWNLSNGGMRIGRGFDVDGASAYYPGYLSNLRLVKGTAVYTSNFTPSATPLTAISNTSLLTCQSSRFVDNSIYAFTLTNQGSPSVQGFSPFAPLTVYNPATYGGSGYFDGSGDYLQAGTSASLALGSGDFTIEGFHYCTGYNGGAALYSTINTYPSSTGLLFYIESGGRYTIDVNGAILQPTNLATLNAWIHYAVVRSSTTITIYINGSSIGTVSSSTNYSDQYAVIGRTGAGSASNFFLGYLSNTRMVKGTAVYTTTFTPPTAPLTPITNTSLLLNTTNPAILDNSMLNNLETVGNAQISTSVVKYGTASMYFEGSSPYGYLKGNANLSQNVAFGTGDFTVECWVNLTTTASDSTIMDTRPGSNAANYFLFYLWTNGGAQLPTIAWYSPTSYVLSTGTVSSGTWTHIAICRASGTIRSFKDGVLQQSASDTRSYANPGAPYPYIGAAYGVGVDSFKGYIDDFRITKYARYTATFTPPTQAFPNG